MKKLLSLALCFCMLILLPVSVMAADAEATLLTDDYSICIGSDASLRPAADYLNRYIQRICGFSLPIIEDSETDACINLAVYAAAQNGYSIETKAKTVTIKANTLRNLVDGICAFLETCGSVHYYTSRVIETADQITLPTDGTVSYFPYFELTETDWFSPCDLDYSLFNGITGESYREIPKDLGGGVDYISGFAHTFTTEFCKSDTYYKNDRKCFATFLGVRLKGVLCLSEPRTLEIVTDEVLTLLKEKHDPNADLQIVSLTQNDIPLFCTCPKCIAKYLKYRSISGLNIEFVNAVADRVKQAGYENVAIDTFAYMYTRSAPKNIVPADNVIVRLCSLECCFSHPLNDPLCSVNRGFARDLQNWAEICNRLYVWDYVTNFANYIGLFPDFNTLQANMQFFTENNVKGIYEEGNYAMCDIDVEFGELRSYLISRLMHDPYCDLHAEREAFLKAFYGENGSKIGTFLDIVSDNAAINHLSIYSAMYDTCRLTPKQIAECDALWTEAKQGADAGKLANIEHSELSWRYWKYRNNVSEYLNPLTRKAERDRYDKDLADTGISPYRECSDTKAFFLGVLQKVRFVLGNVIQPVSYLLELLSLTR